MRQLQLSARHQLERRPFFPPPPPKKNPGRGGGLFAPPPKVGAEGRLSTACFMTASAAQASLKLLKGQAHGAVGAWRTCFAASAPATIAKSSNASGAGLAGC